MEIGVVCRYDAEMVCQPGATAFVGERLYSKAWVSLGGDLKNSSGGGVGIRSCDVAIVLFSCPCQIINGLKQQARN